MDEKANGEKGFCAQPGHKADAGLRHDISATASCVTPTHAMTPEGLQIKGCHGLPDPVLPAKATAGRNNPWHPAHDCGRLTIRRG